MARRRTQRGSPRDRAAAPVDSRWWYWIGAVPAAFGFWLLAVAWVAVAVGLGPLGGGNPLGRAAGVSLVVFLAPFLVLEAVFPFAVHADAAAIAAAAVDWRPARPWLTAAAAVGPAVTAVGIVVDLLENGGFDWLGWAIVAGFVLTVPVAVGYLYRRHEALGQP